MPEEDEVVRRSPYEWGRVIITNLVVVVIPSLIYYNPRVRGHDLQELHLAIVLPEQRPPAGSATSCSDRRTRECTRARILY